MAESWPRVLEGRERGDDCEPGGPWEGHLALLRELEHKDDAPLPSEIGLGPLWWNGAPMGAPEAIVADLLQRETQTAEEDLCWPFGHVVTDRRIDASAATRQHLIDSRAVLDGFDERGFYNREEVRNDDSLAGRAANVERRANTYLTTLLADAPALHLSVGDEGAWFAGQSCVWSATRFTNDDQLPLSALSFAEQRWALMAIQLAQATTAGPPQDPTVHMARSKGFVENDVTPSEAFLRTTWLIVDEPERGLHRTAEAQMARATRDLATTGLRLVLATHSPELLDANAAAVNFVRRRAEGRDGAVVPLSEFDGLRTELGLNPSDMLRRTRGIALVEGEHDLEVLRAAIGPDLDRLGVMLLATRGAIRLKTVVDSRFLYEFTDAVLFPILDDLTMGPVSDLWARQTLARRTQKSSNVIGQFKAELKKLPGKGREFLEEFLAASLQNGTWERVQPLGIPQTDVLACLPVGEFVSQAASWEELREEAARGNGGVDVSESAFKEFLRKSKRADLSEENIRRIAGTSPPHPDIKELVVAMAERLRH